VPLDSLFRPLSTAPDNDDLYNDDNDGGDDDSGCDNGCDKRCAAEMTVGAKASHNDRLQSPSTPVGHHLPDEHGTPWSTSTSSSTVSHRLPL